MPGSEAQGPFVDVDGNPVLGRCAVLFLDLLGIQAMSQSSEAPDHLRRLATALREPYRDFLSEDSPWPAAAFSDAIVICAPLAGSTADEDVGAEVGALAQQAAWLQFNLLRAGFFVRGGLTIAPFHLHENLAFGLTEAYMLENQAAINPRIVLGEDAAAELSGFLDPSDPLLRYDQEDQAFLDYLGLVLSEDPEADALQLVREHGQMVQRMLQESLTNAKHWEKYRWVAEYHNAGPPAA